MPSIEHSMRDEDLKHLHSLVERCQGGDRAAFNELVLQEQHRVYQLAFRILQSSADLDDLVQDIFLLLYRKINTFRSESRFSTWMTRLVVNECLKVLKRRRLSRLLFGAETEDLPDEGAGNSALQVLVKEERHQALRNALKRLPEKQRVVVVLRYFEELPCEEIGAILDCEVGTVRSRLFTARKALRSMMLEYENA